MHESESLDPWFSGPRSSSPGVLDLPVPSVLYIVSLKPSIRVIPCQINTKYTPKAVKCSKSLSSSLVLQCHKDDINICNLHSEIPTTIQGDLPRGTHPDYLYSIYFHTKFTYLYININRMCAFIQCGGTGKG